MKLEVGKLYLTRDGKRVKIIGNEGYGLWPFYGDNNYSYSLNGDTSLECYSIDEPHNPLTKDLIKELTPEEYPEYYI